MRCALLEEMPMASASCRTPTCGGEHSTNQFNARSVLLTGFRLGIFPRKSDFANFIANIHSLFDRLQLGAFCRGRCDPRSMRLPKKVRHVIVKQKSRIQRSKSVDAHFIL